MGNAAAEEEEEEEDVLEAGVAAAEQIRSEQVTKTK